MTKPTETAKLTVAGKELTSFTSFNCASSWGALYRTDAVIDLSEASSGASFTIGTKVSCGDSCELYAAGSLIGKGVIVDKQISFDARQHAVRFRFASFTHTLEQGAAVVPGGQFKGYTFASIARAILKPYGIELDASQLGGDANTVFPKFTIQPGESASQAMGRAAQARGITITGTADGKVKASSQTGAFTDDKDRLVEGVNILAGTVDFDITNVYSEGLHFGQSTGSDNSYGAAVSQVAAKWTNPSFPFFKPLRSFAQTPVTTQEAVATANSAKMEQLYQFLTVQITVQGWLKQNGKLWDCGQWVTVDSDMLNLTGIRLVTDTVSFQQGPGGSITVLTLKFPQGMSPDSQFLNDPRGNTDSSANPDVKIAQGAQPAKPVPSNGGNKE